MARRGRKRPVERLTDREILEWFLQRFSGHRPFAEERKGFLKGPLFGIFLVGPFFTLPAFIAWFGVVPFWYWGIPLGINAVFLLILGVVFYLGFARVERLMPDKLVHFIGVGAFLYVSWLGFYESLMVLLASVGALVRIHGSLWWIPVLIYGVGGIGIWMGRRGILRAIVEGPEAHPWFRPIRLFFATSVGFWIFLSAVGRIFFGWLEHANVNLGLLLLAAWGLSLSLLILGLSLIGVVIGRLHYQRWKGVDELRA